MKHPLTFILLLLCANIAFSQDSQDLRNQKIDGYRGIWFELNQKTEYGDKYSGGLGTYTAKHMPLAIYSPIVEKTFFVYGGTTERDEKHLLCMAGVFDHSTGLVSKPTVVYDKLGVEDPHDNPSICIDEEGYIWVFVSGRNTARQGIKLKSTRPFDINEFQIISEEVFTYPQIWKTEEGFFHFFTKYTGVRELYFETSEDGITWTEDQKIAGIKEDPQKRSGHYQVSGQFKDGSIIGTFFNRHIDGHPDTRTDLYYLQTKDYGKTWVDIHGNPSTLPLREVRIKERVVNYQAQGRNVYMKDMDFDKNGHPHCLYLTSGGFEPGPKNEPYEWCLTSWTGTGWNTSIICESDHNYDMGSLYITDSVWKVVAPTGKGPQEYGAGGEIVIWNSFDEGQTWVKNKEVTKSSPLNHSYIRRPVNAKAPFSFFWASGNPEELSISEIYFGDFEGNIWKLPYHMSEESTYPH